MRAFAVWLRKVRRGEQVAVGGDALLKKSATSPVRSANTSHERDQPFAGHARACGGGRGLRAGLSEPASDDHRAAGGGRRQRHSWSDTRAGALEGIRPAVRGGEPRRRERQHRYPGGGKSAARRLHAALHHQRRPCGQSHAVRKGAVRPGEGLRPGHAGRHRAVPAGGASGGAQRCRSTR